MAYNRARVIAIEPTTGGLATVTVRFTGNAGETPVDQTTDVGPTTTVTQARQWAKKIIASLNWTPPFPLKVGDDIDIS